MTHLMAPLVAAEMMDRADEADASVAEVRSSQDDELTTLVRLWMAAGGKVHKRGRRDRILRLAPIPVEDSPVEDSSVEDSPVEVDVTDVGPVEADPVGPVAADDRPLRSPALPRRTTADEVEQVNRVALLVDARRVPADAASALLAMLGERGAVNVCRAYADWNRADLVDWAGQMRKEGLHSFHHFSDDDDQALVAMAIDAVDIARDAAVDEVVIAGDLTSALPLVHRLHAAGVRVVAVGAGHTPHDVRAACHEFIDTASIDGSVVVAQGRHRA